MVQREWLNEVSGIRTSKWRDHVRDVLNAIDEAVCKVICRVDLPLVACPVVGSIEDTISREIPHLGIAVGEVLLHAEEGFLWLILAVLHGLELGKGFGDGAFAMHARAGETLLLSSVELDFLL